jgi:hypothetical protein
VNSWYRQTAIIHAFPVFKGDRGNDNVIDIACVNSQEEQCRISHAISEAGKLSWSI